MFQNKTENSRLSCLHGNRQNLLFSFGFMIKPGWSMTEWFAYLSWHSSFPSSAAPNPAGAPSRNWDVTVNILHKLAELAHSCFFFFFLLCYSVCFCLYCPLTGCRSINSPDNSPFFSLCSSGLISALLVLSTLCLFMKVSCSPDIIPSGWLGSKHRLTN